MIDQKKYQSVRDEPIEQVIVDPYRWDIEKQILGSCICENSYIEVSHLLNTSNFTSHHQQVWRALGHLYPDHVVDVLTITHHLQSHHPPPIDLPWSYIVTDLDAHAGGGSIGSNSLILIQIDMRDHFTRCIQDLHDGYIRSGQPHQADLCKGLLQEIPTLDILTEHTTINTYLSENGIKAVSLDKFADQVNAKAQKIKQAQQMYALGKHLSRLARISSRNTQAVTSLLDIVAQLIWSDRDLSYAEINAIENIKEGAKHVV